MMARRVTRRRAETLPRFYPPYPPSWFDRFTAWIDRLPGPYWAWYLALGCLIFLLETIVQWTSGEYPIGTFRWLHVLLAGSVTYVPFLMHYLDRTAGTALDSLRPALAVSAAEYADLRFRLTNLPGRSVTLGIVFGAVYGAAVVATGQIVNMLQISLSPLSVAFNGALAALTGFSVYLFGHHLLRQLAMVNDIYTRRTHIHLFRLGPLYALSGLTARTAIGLAVPGYAWIAAAPELLRIPVSVGGALVGSVIAAATFALPLLGVHRLLAEEKERWIGEASRRYESLVVRLHQSLDQRKSRRVVDCREGLAALEIELTRLEKVPTWPWQPQTVRGLAAALLLPVAVWLIQWVLQRVVG